VAIVLLVLSFACALARYVISAPRAAEISGVPVEAGEFRVDLNTADEARLSLLPGIGPVTANKIIEYREKNGPFRNVSELELVDGIGPAKLKAVRRFVSAGDEN